MVGLNWIFILRNESFHLKSWCHCTQLIFSWGQWNSWGLRDRLLCLPLQKSHLFPLLDPVSIISSATTTTDSDTASIPATITAAIATPVTVSAAVSTVSECKEIFFSVESNRKCFQNKSDVNNHRLKTEFLPSMLILQKCKNNYTSNKFIFWSIFDVFWVRSLSTVFADSKKLKKQMGKRLGPLCAMLQ